ncbi:MAG: hypothetical protein NTX03_01535 [Bacteroidetes bacterium]|nr:hypothetical protein [Bacteroidota bacterium]
MEKFYCKCCGSSSTSLTGLTSGNCFKNPEGKHHALYEGSEKSQYACKYCGSKASTLTALTSGNCFKNPNGKNHSPAL